MKKVLILAYDFPPYTSVGGLRPYSWYKYFREFGIDPVVVTRDWQNSGDMQLDYIRASSSQQNYEESFDRGTIIRTAYNPTLSNRLLLKYGSKRFVLIRKVLTAINEVGQYLGLKGSKTPLLNAAEIYLKSNKVDAIIATGEPFVLFHFAAKLSRRYNTPWIADFRDPWSRNSTLNLSPLHQKVLQLVEEKTVENVSVITTPYPFKEDLLGCDSTNKKIQLIPNGYDVDDIEFLNSIESKGDLLSIAFAGTIYKWHPWKSCLDAFADVCNTSIHNMELQFYGTNINEEIAAYIKKFPSKVRSSIQLHNRLPNLELLENLKRSHALLLFNDYAIMGTKIYDYLLLNRKILLCYGNDLEANQLKQNYYTYKTENDASESVQMSVLNATKAGVMVENEDDFRMKLWDLVDEFSLKGKVECNSSGTEIYSRKFQVKKLAEIIHSTIS